MYPSQKKRGKAKKFSGINLTKDVRDYNNEKCKTIVKEIKDDAKIGKTSYVHGLGELIL